MGHYAVTPDPLLRFETEHLEALRALDRLERAAVGLRGSEPAEPHLAAAAAVLHVLTSEVRRHNEDEERSLFAVLGEDAPLGPFVEEHHTLRGLERELGAALRAGDRERVASAAQAIVDLLRLHISRENQILFPMARALLGREGLAAVARRLG